MKYRIDPHTHTIASGHAYNTVREMAVAAAAKGIELLGLTDHGPALWGASSQYYFRNFHAIDRTAYGVRLLMGAEANITDCEGSLDLPDETISELDILIASFHMQCFQSGTPMENTEALLHVMRRHTVTILGHPDDGKFPIDYEAVVLEAKKRHVLIELNNASLAPKSFRRNGRENSRIILEFCKRYDAEIVLSSDAHFDCEIGNFRYAEELMGEVAFPEELVINSSPERFMTYLPVR